MRKRMGWLACLGLASGAVLLGVRFARASCSAPTKCVVAEVVVRGCTVLDPEQEPGVARYAEELRKQKDTGRVRALLDAYRGVVVEVEEKRSTTLDCRRGLARKVYDDAAYRLGGTAETASIVRYFAPTTAANACAQRFPVGRALRLSSAASCCDGDPGPPCLMNRSK